ncbi:MAG: chondroitinase-B domain-containing protein [Nitrospirota bacterium]
MAARGLRDLRCGGSYLCPIAVNNPNKLKPGDTLYLRAGTYNESNIRFANSGAAGAPITVASHPGKAAEIDGGYTATSQLTGKGAHLFRGCSLPPQKEHSMARPAFRPAAKKTGAPAQARHKSRSAAQGSGAPKRHGKYPRTAL